MSDTKLCAAGFWHYESSSLVQLFMWWFSFTIKAAWWVWVIALVGKLELMISIWGQTTEDIRVASVTIINWLSNHSDIWFVTLVASSSCYSADFLSFRQRCSLCKCNVWLYSDMTGLVKATMLAGALEEVVSLLVYWDVNTWMKKSVVSLHQWWVQRMLCSLSECEYPINFQQFISITRSNPVKLLLWLSRKSNSGAYADMRSICKIAITFP